MTHITSRAATAAVLVAVLLAATAGCAHSGGASPHSAIRPSSPAGASVPQATPDFEEVVRIVDAWAARNGLRREQPGEPRRLSWATSAANGNERTLYFREVSPAGNAEMPVEVLIA